MSTSTKRPSQSDPEPSVSVVIPTFRDWDRLTECFKALEAQTYPSRLIEVLVVNNDAADQAPSVFPYAGEIRLLSEAAPGSYAARHREIEAVSGQIIAFAESTATTATMATWKYSFYLVGRFDGTLLSGGDME